MDNFKWDDELDLKAWLAQPPLPEEIRHNEDGSAYIPIEFIKPKLDYLCPNWETKNFNHLLIPANDGGLICSGSVELHFYYKIDMRTEMGRICAPTPLIMLTNRVITGSATFFTSKYHPNFNWGQTCLSLCIVASAKELGEFFGKSLNKDMLTVPFNELSASKKRNDKMLSTIKKISTSK